MQPGRYGAKRIVDMHCHILPGIDDGAKSMEMSLQMLQTAQDEGITDIIATPHYQSGRFYTPPDAIEEMIGQLQEHAVQRGIHIGIYPGTEIYYRSGLESKLDAGELAAMNYTNYVLVEFSPLDDFNCIRNGMEELRGMGYIPILAHVERFRCMLEDMELVEILKRVGCRISANAGSIAGDYGFRVKRYLGRLLAGQLIDYVGTDAHNAEGRSPRIRKCAELLYKKYDPAYADDILYGNAERTLLEEDE